MIIFLKQKKYVKESNENNAYLHLSVIHQAGMWNYSSIIPQNIRLSSIRAVLHPKELNMITNREQKSKNLYTSNLVLYFSAMQWILNIIHDCRNLNTRRHTTTTKGLTDLTFETLLGLHEHFLLFLLHIFCIDSIID